MMGMQIVTLLLTMVEKLLLFHCLQKMYLLIIANLKRKGKRLMQKQRLKKNQMKKRARVKSKRVALNLEKKKKDRKVKSVRLYIRSSEARNVLGVLFIY